MTELKNNKRFVFRYIPDYQNKTHVKHVKHEFKNKPFINVIKRLYAKTVPKSTPKLMLYTSGNCFKKMEFQMGLGANVGPCEGQCITYMINNFFFFLYCW